MIKKTITLVVLSVTIAVASCQNSVKSAADTTVTTAANEVSEQPKDLAELNTAYFASGCFWCVEAVYESVKGVAEAESGYSGGKEKNPTYHNLGSHAETVKVYYDSSIVDFPTLVDVYYGSQDPTTFGQHPDLGEHYRSIIFYQNDTEKLIAEKKKKELDSSGKYADPVITEIKAFEKFWIAEDYHQDYEKLHPEQSYVKAVSIPRLKRFQAKHKNLLKQAH